MDYWNELIKIRDSKSTSPENKHISESFLSQLNTAGGIHHIKNEIKSFINKIK